MPGKPQVVARTVESAILDWLQYLGVAEGIETDEEARALTELGVEYGQGYWFGRPEPVDGPPGDAAAGIRADPGGGAR
jgi:predicted signal transduction protein with EAL and GGDEF domain